MCVFFNRTLFLLSATQTETMCETQKGIISLSIPGKDGRQTETNIVQSAAEPIHQGKAGEGDSSFFIPWRKHLLETEEPENLTQKSSSPEEKLSLKPATPPEKQEGQSVNENMPVTGENQPTCFANVGKAAEDTSILVGEAQQTVEHTDHNVQVLMESFGILKECCDKMCMSMSNLQGVLEMLITVLKE